MKTYMLLMLMSIFVFVSYFPVPREAKSQRAVVRRSLRIDSPHDSKGDVGINRRMLLDNF